MRRVVLLVLISAVALSLLACVAKTPKPAVKQEFSVPPDAVTTTEAGRSAYTPPESKASNVARAVVATPDSSAELAAFESARPVFKKHCSRCHTESSGKLTALKHFVMDTYPFGGHHAASMPATIRQVLGQSGKRATMPKDKPGVVSGDELKTILEWADAAEHAAATGPKPTDRHDEHDHKH